MIILLTLNIDIKKKERFSWGNTIWTETEKMSESEADEENRAEESGPVNIVCERIRRVQTPQDLAWPGTVKSLFYLWYPPSKGYQSRNGVGGRI